METPDDGSADRAGAAWSDLDGRAGPRRRVPWWFSVGALAVLVVLVVTASLLSGGSTSARATATATATATARATATAHPSAVPEPMSVTPTDSPSTDLVALAARLPAGVSLAAPATWAGAAPVYDHPVDGCPHIAALLGAQLGGRWTYAFGTLPQGPSGCSWVPVPYVPDGPPADRFFLTVGFVTGGMADLLTAPFYSGSSTPCPRLDVAGVAPGAVLTGCGRSDTVLALPDAGGTGVWYLSSSGGEDQRTYSTSDGLLALLDAVRTAYR